MVLSIHCAVFCPSAGLTNVLLVASGLQSPLQYCTDHKRTRTITNGRESSIWLALSDSCIFVSKVNRTVKSSKLSRCHSRSKYRPQVTNTH